MVDPTNNRFISYYHKELTYLRNAGRVFAQKHPKIARRLDYTDTESPDPHLERLLDSFAFLTARINQELDDRFPMIASNILSVLCPPLTQPLPAMAIAYFQVDPTKGKLTSGFDIPKATPLFAYSEEKIMCRFQTIYPVTLWPIQVIGADFIHGDAFTFSSTVERVPWYLRLTLKALTGTLSDLNVKSLVFHITGDRITSFSLYELLFAGYHLSGQDQAFIVRDGQNAIPLPKDSLKSLGFSEDETAVPCPAHTHPAYQLLQEYFHFPEKFLFFEIKNLSFQESQQQIELLLPISDGQKVNHLRLEPKRFCLGCSPIVNLFPKITDPFKLDRQKMEYRLVPDQRRERTTEIHSILEVFSTDSQKADPLPVMPYFSFNHLSLNRNDQKYWVSRRVPSDRKEIPGTDVYLSFVDLKFNPNLPAQETIYAKTLCVNRFLAEQLPPEALLQMEDKLPVSKIIALDKPVPQAYPPTDGESLWRLISLLTVNHLSLTQGQSSLEALKETLRIYSSSAHVDRHLEIEALQHIKAEPIVRRIGGQAWCGFVKGLRVHLNMSEKFHTGGSAFLLASVLRHFLAQTTAINSFIELELSTPERQGLWMKWKPLPGEQILR